ncbi:hypothetical protein E8E11_003566 [Didymella keratinophila]|nr:hypothetical protein E8E11_003566 [Didymella keratinophila]
MAARDFSSDYNQNFGDSTSDGGLIGLGFQRNQQVDDPDDQYPTLPELLREQKRTASTVFSMWFYGTNDEGTFEASILFGGYVSNFFKAPLTIFRMQPTTVKDNVTEIVVQLDRIVFRGVDAFVNCTDNTDVLLDTGTYSSWLPLDSFKRIVIRLSSLADNNGNYH